MDGERRLTIAVLEDAVSCCRKYANAKDPRGRELFNEAWEWIISEDRAWILSFLNICDTLGLDPGYLRRGLRALCEKNRRQLGGSLPASAPSAQEESHA